MNNTNWGGLLTKFTSGLANAGNELLRIITGADWGGAGNTIKNSILGGLSDLGNMIANGVNTAVSAIHPTVTARVFIPSIPPGSNPVTDITKPTYMAYASGGVVTSPTLGVVGEAGPEAIIPLTPGRRMDNVPMSYRRWLVNSLTYSGILGPQMESGLHTGLMQHLTGMGRVPMYAAGGVATSPTLGVFGEAGPEALLPLAGLQGSSNALDAINSNTFNLVDVANRIAEGVAKPKPAPKPKKPPKVKPVTPVQYKGYTNEQGQKILDAIDKLVEESFWKDFDKYRKPDQDIIVRQINDSVGGLLAKYVPGYANMPVMEQTEALKYIQEVVQGLLQGYQVTGKQGGIETWAQFWAKFQVPGYVIPPTKPAESAETPTELRLDRQIALIASQLPGYANMQPYQQTRSVGLGQRAYSRANWNAKSASWRRCIPI